MGSGGSYTPSYSTSSNLGYSTGGAKGIGNFRENIIQDCLPLPTDMTYEGLFYEYYFQKEGNEECNKLFCPTYTYAISKDPLSQEKQYYLSIGLNSGIKEDFKKITSVKEIDMDALKREILDISPDGGTNLERGYAKATSLFDQYPEFNEQEYENRIIFLTDAMLNLGSTRSQDLLESTEQNAGKKVYSTFIGVGVDFNTELIEYITKIRGANYYSVHSSREFKSRMDD